MDQPSSVLVVDDRPASRYTLVRALKRAGFDVVEVGTGKEALELAQQMPSAILLDVKLPDILGYEVCRRLKTNPKTSHIPILQLSAAFIDNESRVYALESGADAYLTQPVEPNVLLATVRSLIKLNRAESMAKLSAKQWQATFDALGEGVALVNEEGIISRCNGALCELLERPYMKIEGHRLEDLLRESLGLQSSEFTNKGVREVVAGARFFQVRVEPVSIDGDHPGSVFVLADITAQKLAENAAVMNERLAATGRMAHTIAHEINNPLAAITNLLFLLRSPADKEEAAAHLASAEAEVARVSRISRQILAFHRESAQRIDVNLPDLLEEVLALNNRDLLEKDLRVSREWNKPVRVHAFPAQMRQVFSNVIRNAIEASFPGGEIRVRVSQSLRQDADLRLLARVTVADHGVGIPRRNLNRIFEAFFTTKELKGTGIGLWLSSNIVQEHGGHIQVRSSTRAGQSGSCISVVLPTGAQIPA